MHRTTRSATSRTATAPAATQADQAASVRRPDAAAHDRTRIAEQQIERRPAVTSFGALRHNDLKPGSLRDQLATALGLEAPIVG